MLMVLAKSAAALFLGGAILGQQADISTGSNATQGISAGTPTINSPVNPSQATNVQAQTNTDAQAQTNVGQRTIDAHHDVAMGRRHAGDGRPRVHDVIRRAHRQHVPGSTIDRQRGHDAGRGAASVRGLRRHRESLVAGEEEVR